MRPIGRRTSDWREMSGSSRSTTPHTQENLQAGARVGGIHRRSPTLKSADTQREVIGNGGEGQGVRVGRLDRLLRQGRISSAAAFDTWAGRGVPRLARRRGGRLVATRRLLHRGEICPVVLHERTARPRRESQDQARGDGKQLVKKRVHIRLYATEVRIVGSKRQFRTHRLSNRRPYHLENGRRLGLCYLIRDQPIKFVSQRVSYSDRNNEREAAARCQSQERNNLLGND